MSKLFWIETKQMDAEQRHAVENIPADESFLVNGPAGSGKTNILLLRSRYLTLKKLSDFKIISFTSSLKEFMVEGCKLYGVNPESVITQRQFFRDILEEYSIPYEIVNDFEADRDMLAGKVKSLVDSAKISQNFCTTLLIDEAQDYSDTELLVFRAVTKNLVLASDSRQSIYKVTHTPYLLEKLVGNQTVELITHYRSGVSLCKVADAILKDSSVFKKVHGSSKYPEAIQPSSVVSVPCEDFHEQAKSILASLTAQVELYPDEYLGVLFPKREQVAMFENILKTNSISKERIRVNTMHGAKGWEFRAVHLGGCEALSKMGATQKRLIYTAILRGKTSVRVYYSGHLPGYFTAALAVLEAPVADMGLDDLMKGLS